LVWLWVPVLLFGMFIVPWLAVIFGERPSAEAQTIPDTARPAPTANAHRWHSGAESATSSDLDP